MAEIVGIDLGTTNSLLGVMDAGFPILIADATGERLTPSVVHFPEHGEPIVGRAALRMRTLAPAETISSVKRFMGRRIGEADDDFDMACELIGQKGTPVRFRIRDRVISPEDVSSRILAKLKTDAECALQQPVGRAVITVPAYFNDAQRNATKSAGEFAGFTVERIINEPTAAALAYGLDKLKERSKIAVYDLGGGTFDISILELSEGVFQVISTNGNTRLGGDDIDRALMTLLSERLDAGAIANLDAASHARIREAAIAAKHRLSDVEETAVEIPFLTDNTSLITTLARAELESVARPILDRTRDNCIRVLLDANLTPADLDEVILVGGSTRMPVVRKFVADIFGRVPNSSQNPDEAVAIGATIQAGILSGTVKHMVLLDVTPLSLGIETFGGLMNVIIPRNSTIPVKMGEMFTNALANQSGMQIKVLQGEREMARDNWPLGCFDIAFEPAPRGQARVGVQFSIDANGILEVLARDTFTGRQHVIEIRSVVDVSDEAVEKMIAESVDYAFDDISERIFTEAKLKSEEMLPAVRNALTLVGDKIDESERRHIEELMGRVMETMAADNAQQLKLANAALDEATQNLATILIENAIESAMRKKGLL
jgi:molecular chaperone DnaK